MLGKKTKPKKIVLACCKPKTLLRGEREERGIGNEREREGKRGEERGIGNEREGRKERGGERDREGEREGRREG